MAQDVGVYPALLEDQSLVPTTHIGCLITVHKSSFRGSNPLFWSPQAAALTCAPTWMHVHTDTQTQIFKKRRRIWTTQEHSPWNSVHPSVRRQQFQHHFSGFSLDKKKELSSASIHGATFCSEYLSSAFCSGLCSVWGLNKNQRQSSWCRYKDYATNTEETMKPFHRQDVYDWWSLRVLMGKCVLSMSSNGRWHFGSILGTKDTCWYVRGDISFSLKNF